MLIEFSVTNFRSFNETQTFSMVKAKGDELKETNTFVAQDFVLVKSAAIYGPNASGKSNLLKSLKTMRSIVLGSAKGSRGDFLSLTPFRLDKNMTSAPSEFEISMMIEGVRYQYGFSATSERINEEWLIAYPKGRPQRWFDRVWDENNQNYSWQLGGKLVGEKQLWKKTTRDNALFLSTAVQLNSTQLHPIHDWFKNVLRVMNDNWKPGFHRRFFEEQKKDILEFVRSAGVDINDIRVEDEDVKIPINKQYHSTVTRSRLKSVREDVDGELVEFGFGEESDGTQKLFALARPWIDSLHKGHVIFIDELHGHLHPRLVKFLVQLFHNHETNPNNAQLVFTTHETSILHQDVFRRDQIWFCEKSENKSTALFPLTDFKPRKGQNLELAYLSGKYGAVPFIRSKSL